MCPSLKCYHNFCNTFYIPILSRNSVWKVHRLALTRKLLILWKLLNETIGAHVKIFLTSIFIYNMPEYFWINPTNCVNSGWDVTTNRISLCICFLNLFSLDKITSPISLLISFLVYPCYINQGLTLNMCCCKSFFFFFELFLSTTYLLQCLALENISFGMFWMTQTIMPIGVGRNQWVLCIIQLTIDYWLKWRLGPKIRSSFN